MNSFYITSAVKAEQLPSYDLPEIAFVGRSNCGKSTLLNGLLQRKNLARTSRTPGRTQMVNFFNLNNTHIFADLPGYGFSQTSRETRKHWQGLATAYLNRQNISFVLFLMDCRREPDDDDWELLNWVCLKHQTLVVLTKSDKISRSQLLQQIAKLKAACQSRSIAPLDFCGVSSLQSDSLDSLRQKIMS